MFKLLKGGYCYNPDDTGVNDILIANGKIMLIREEIDPAVLWDVEVIDCSGMIVCPGFIDQHVHISGGGCEQGPSSKIPELMLGDIIKAGVTTVVGLLGADAVTRTVEEVLTKARSLKQEGISAYIYTGSYSIPPVTITGDVTTDIFLINEVIGVGEIAISDYRSSYPNTQQLKQLASKARLGGMLGGKPGLMHIHVGDGKEGIAPLTNLIESTDLPVDMFVPTHLNRNKALFFQALEFASRGGNIDLTAGEKSGTGFSVPEAMYLLANSGISLDKVTISSDGNGGMPTNGSGSNVGRVTHLFEDIKRCIIAKKLTPGGILRCVTMNAAKTLRLYPQKGTLLAGSDADILVINPVDYTINKLLASGELFIDEGKTIRKSSFEGNECR